MYLYTYVLMFLMFLLGLKDLTIQFVLYQYGNLITRRFINQGYKLLLMHRSDKTSYRDDIRLVRKLMIFSLSYRKLFLIFTASTSF